MKVRVTSIRRKAREARQKAHEAKEKMGEMSVFGKLFKKKEAPLTREDAIGQLHDTEELLVKKQEYYEKKIEEEVANAKRHGQKNQKMALSALRRKKHYETELSRIDGTLAKLEAQRTALEDAGTNVEVLNVLAGATKALKKANMDLDIDKVNDLMDDITEQLQDSKEFADAISQPIGDVADEDDLMNELKELEEAAASEKLAGVPEVDDLPELPTVPMTTRSKAKIQKQDTMAELEAWAAAN